jgi:transcriptional regulator with XRE-family HTH domain
MVIMPKEPMGAIEYGQFFRRIRRQEDVKQAILAKKLGVSQPAISDIERGDRKDFSEEDVERTLRALAEASGMDANRYESILAEGMAAAGFAYIPRSRKLTDYEDFPEIERVPDEDDVFQTLAAYNGGDPGIKSLQQLAEIIKSAKTLTPDMKEEELSGLN